MPRLREDDGRRERFESAIRDSERAKLDLVSTRKGLPFCNRCKTPFEEISRTCPKCETKTMGYIRNIPEKHLEEANRNAIRRARERQGL